MSDAFKQYLRSADKHPRLTLEQELALFGEWQSGNVKSRDKLLLSNLRYVIEIAIKNRHYNVPVEDLVAAGNEGLVMALNRFDPSLRLKFVTYCSYWIRSRIHLEIFFQWTTVEKPHVLRGKTFFRLRREAKRALAILGDSDEAMELIARRTGIDADRVRHALQLIQRGDRSLDAPLSSDSIATLGELIEANEPTPLEELIGSRSRQQASAQAKQALKKLDRREELIIRKRYMVDKDDELSLAELGRKMGVSRERVRQLEVRAMKKLRRHFGVERSAT